MSIDIPGYKAGTWTIDPVHSEVGFSIRHLMISKVKGVFENFDATFVTAENPLESTVSAKAHVASINTKNSDRDAHLRTGDFFLAEEFPTIDFVSTGVRHEGGEFLVFGGFGQDPYGNYKAGATAKTKVNREDFGLTYNAALETGGMLLGDDVVITLELQAVLNQA